MSLLERALLGAVLASCPAAARADGAFPDELQVFAPAASPHAIVLGANFGLVQSADDGQSWAFVCEGLISGSSLVTMYGLGPDGSVFAISGGTALRSVDQGCSWSPSNAIPGSSLRDLFVDPLDVQNVWVIADGFEVEAPNALYLSTDGGATFGAPAYTEAAGYLAGVEASHTEGHVLVSGYFSARDGGSDLPYLARTADLGATWAQALHPELEPRRIAIAQVYPSDDHVAYLRLFGTGQDALAVTDASGGIQNLLELDEPMSAFALGGDGTLYVGAKSGHLWVREPGATSFTLGSGPKLRCLAERAGTLYACGDDLVDGFALGVSTDHGATFHGLLRLQDIATLEACPPVQRACAVSLAMLQSVIGDTTPSSSSGSTGGRGGGRHGCGCDVGEGAGWWALLGSLLRRRRVRACD